MKGMTRLNTFSSTTRQSNLTNMAMKK